MGNVMSDWVKLAIGILAGVCGYFLTEHDVVQKHEYRLDTVESTVTTHLTAHEKDRETNNARITEIQRTLDQMTGRLK